MASRLGSRALKTRALRDTPQASRRETSPSAGSVGRAAEAAGRGVRPGMVATVHTATSGLLWSPHVHAIASRGGWDSDGAGHPVPYRNLQGPGPAGAVRGDGSNAGSAMLGRWSRAALPGSSPTTRARSEKQHEIDARAADLVAHRSWTIETCRVSVSWCCRVTPSCTEDSRRLRYVFRCRCSAVKPPRSRALWAARTRFSRGSA